MSEQYSADYYSRKGLFCIWQKDYKGALDNYNKAIALDSAKTDIDIAFHNRGYIREILQDTLGALDDYRKAIQLNDRNPQAHNNIGCILSAQGKDQEAIEFYKTAIEIKSNYYSAYFSCACSQFRIKDYEEALKNFKNYLQHAEDWELSASAYYYMGLIYKSTGELGKAKEYLEKAKALGNNDAEEELKTF